ncbi:MAG: hypothetical protein RMM17_11885 [Acidobacteriota bacterium]|nr:hypothetical protein [Blastocatellia bacterium]MDW8413373.1 hypothetical protein [Acidobacteriota bacterium]
MILIVACVAVLLIGIVMLEVHLRDRHQLKELIQYLSNLGFSFRWGCPVVNPFLYERLDKLCCYDGKLADVQATLILGRYSTGKGRDLVVNSMMGLYFPPEADLSDGWLLEWKMQVARRGDDWAAYSGVDRLKVEWGALGPPESLPVRAVRLPNGGVILAWYCLPLKRNVEEKVNSVIKSFKNKKPTEQSFGEIVTTQVQLKELKYYKCPSCDTAVSSSRERINCPYCGCELYASQYPKSTPPHTGQLPIVPKPHWLRYATSIAALGLLPLAMSYGLDHRVPLFGLDGAPIAAVAVTGAAAISWIWARRPLPAVSMMTAASLLLLMKPFFMPADESEVNGLDADYYFLLPGVLLAAFAAIFGLLLWESKRAMANSSGE